MSTTIDLATYLAAAAAGAAAVLRWLRVAQREHYEPGRVTRFAILWAVRRPVNLALLATAAVLAGLTPAIPLSAIPALALLAVWPIGLSIRPRTGALQLTGRLRRLLIAQVIVFVIVALLADTAGATWSVLLAAPLTDLCLAVLKRPEAAFASRFVTSAKAKLRRLEPVVVAITGSYGKTSTKQYTAHLVGTTRNTVASPASFNNLMGLSRTVNDRLLPGTEVFIAEMGTYGPGEIRRLCAIFKPTIVAITTIGEAHLERMRTRAAIVAAKSEIVEHSEVAVLNVDVPELAELADRLDGRQRVVRCSTERHPRADIVVTSQEAQARAWIQGRELGEVCVPPGSHLVNVAVALGIAHALGIAPAALRRGLSSLPVVDHRATVHRVDGGPTIIDDTYNANPPGAARAVETARRLVGVDGRLWVVTPGMVELGSRQFQRNSALAEAVAAIPGAVLAVIGHTNRKALLQGAARHPHADVRRFESRQDAVDSVARELRVADVVLYENDLPDHYP